MEGLNKQPQLIPKYKTKIVHHSEVVNTAYNINHSRMNNKGRDVIGREGSVFIIRVKRSDINAVGWTRQGKGTPLFIAQVTEFE